MAGRTLEIHAAMDVSDGLSLDSEPHVRGQRLRRHIRPAANTDFRGG